MCVRGLDQHLSDDRKQTLREEALGLFALFDRQRIDDAVDGLHGAGGVERAQHEVTGLGGRHCHGDGLRIAQLADQDHVRVFAHRCAYALREARDVCAQLALDDLTVLAAVDELDRILEADDVELSGLVQVVDHRRERRRLAGARGAGDEHHALMEVAQLGDDGRQRQLLERGHFRRNGAEGRTDARVLAIDVDAEPASLPGDI